MPWSSNKDLPDQVRSVLPTAAQTRFRTVANAALEGGASDQSAIRQAWHVVGLGWEKGEDGNWVRKVAKTMYVSRPVLNADDIIKWAKSAGFTTTMPAEELHVTIAYSKTPVEWGDMGDHFDDMQVSKTEGRSVVKLGDKGAVVLKFQYPDLEKRWKELIEKGASWDWDGYQPHITITYQAPSDLDLSKVKPYDGTIKLGAERFAEIDDGWSDDVTEKYFNHIAKVGRRHTQREFDQLQQMHDMCVDLGAKCEGMEKRATASPEPRSFVIDDGTTFSKGSLLKYDDNLGLVFGWAIVCKRDGEDYFDLQGDHITEKAMLEAAADFMVNSRMAKDMHQGDEIGTVVFCWPMTADVAKAMGIDTKQTGLMIAMKPPDAIVDKFRSGEYTGFSIGGTRIKDEAA